MTNPERSSFVYVTYIRATPEKVWAALTTAEFMRQYWFGMDIETDWIAGSPWKLKFSDGRVADSGTIIAAEPPRRLVLLWRNQFRPELHAEGDARCTIELEAADGVVKLAILHEIDRAESRLIGAVGGGWPKIIANLKSWLETGEAIMAGWG